MPPELQVPEGMPQLPSEPQTTLAEPVTEAFSAMVYAV